MATRFQVTVDCSDPNRLAHFWAEVLGYEIEGPPPGFESWKAYWQSVGVPDEDLEVGDDSIIDPDGIGPRMWFQRVPESKVVKNRIHLDLQVSGGRGFPLEVRKQRINAEADRLVGIGATRPRVLQGAVDHYAVAMQDPEGNEFDIG